MITMITTCPGCRTAFRVTPEQLAAREGRVRCGSCATIFDARAGLETRPPDAAPASARQAADRTGQAAAPAVPETAPIPASVPAAPDSGTVGPGFTDATPAPAPPGEQPDTAAAHEIIAAFPTAAPQPSRRSARWAAGCSLLAVVLAAQLGFHYRGEIALQFPELRPALAELCASLDCEVPLPRRAQLISIESSDLQADPGNPGVMVLTATLRNRAAFAQSHPSLELTLTDSQDRPLARRVLAVQDYLGRRVNAEAGFPGNSELPVRVYMDAAPLKATGYRLYLFFP